MNESGRSIGEAMRFFKMEAQDVTVFHDELDLAPFRVKVKPGGGTAGPNGIRSTAPHIGNAFRRGRLGLGPPGPCARVPTHLLGNSPKAKVTTPAHTPAPITPNTAGW